MSLPKHCSYEFNVDIKLKRKVRTGKNEHVLLLA